MGTEQEQAVSTGQHLQAPADQELQWTFPAPAKLNLFLHITGRREDGYHNIETLFQILNWGDTLHFQMISSPAIEFSQSPHANFPDDKNLVVQAAHLLTEHTGCRNGVRIHLEKKIPSGAGLGGGSSDAATTLLALNKIWELGLSQDELVKLGLELGADVPVFIKGDTAFGTGVGENLMPIKTPNNWYLIVVPDVHASTRLLFSSPSLTRDSIPIRDIALAMQEGRNNFQTVAENTYPLIAKTRKILEKHGPVRMSGSGSSLFIEFEDKLEAEQLLAQLTNEDMDSYSAVLAQGVTRSPVLELLGNSK